MNNTFEKHRILVTLPVGEKEKELFRQAAPGSDFLFVSDNLKDEIKISPSSGMLITNDAAPQDVEGRDIILGNISPKLLENAKDLRFFQLYSAGTNQYINGELPEDVTLCCASGAYGIAIAEHMLAMILTLIKKIDTYCVNKEKHAWKDEGPVRGIYGSVTLVVGAGNIGTELAKRMKALGSRCIAIRRQHSEPDGIFDTCGTMEDLDRFLPEADFVVSTLPETAHTKGIFDSERFALMKNDALFVNIGRGSVADSVALADALNSGKIGGACIDVTHIEPLPEDDPLWDARNLIITPHVSGGYHLQYTYDSILRIMTENLKNYLSGGPLISEVDMSSGYRKKN